MDMSVINSKTVKKKENSESDEEELNLTTIEQKKPSEKNNAINNEAHRKLNPLSAAKYKNSAAPTNENRSKTKSPFKYSNTDTQAHNISVNKTPQGKNKNNSKNPNLLPISFVEVNFPADTMLRSPGKNKLYEKIFQRAQQLDIEEKIRHEEVSS